jgi:lysozyme family protein
MRENFPRAVLRVMLEEGGFVDDPHDPGGATNYGITQAVYNAYRRSKAVALKPVRLITRDEVEDIYRHQYADSIRFDDLPVGIDYCVFDEAVNSGVVRAIKALQLCVGVADDGVVGLRTLEAVQGCKDRAALIDRFCDRRVSFLRSLTSLFTHFGRGWLRRVADVRAASKGMLT